MNNGSFVRIKGNSVELVTEHIERRVSLEDLFTQYSRRIGMASGMLPENCKMIITKRGRSIYVVEQKP